ncbi:hypothetical protein FB451DRAFT_1173415 [Mycena latifolia]|nr:hypothetical protein FB451DRAFT_1173415 [Mycena latifolia]
MHSKQGGSDSLNHGYIICNNRSTGQKKNRWIGKEEEEEEEECITAEVPIRNKQVLYLRTSRPEYISRKDLEDGALEIVALETSPTWSGFFPEFHRLSQISSFFGNVTQSKHAHTPGTGPSNVLSIPAAAVTEPLETVRHHLTVPSPSSGEALFKAGPCTESIPFSQIEVCQSAFTVLVNGMCICPNEDINASDVEQIESKIICISRRPFLDNLGVNIICLDIVSSHAKDLYFIASGIFA